MDNIVQFLIWVGIVDVDRHRLAGEHDGVVHELRHQEDELIRGVASSSSSSWRWHMSRR